MSGSDPRDDLVQAFDAIGLANKKKPSFVGGFNIGSKPGNQSAKPLPSLPSDSAPAFPVPSSGTPYLHPSSPAGPLPRPPAMMSIPVPHHNHGQPQSLTMQYATSPTSHMAPRPTPSFPVSAPSTPPPAKPHTSRPSDQLKPPRPGPSHPSHPVSDSAVKPAAVHPSSPQAKPKPTVSVSPLHRPGRKRANSSPPQSPVVSSSNEDSVQCSGVTKSGKRCSRTVKLGGSGLDELEEDGEVIRYCHQHSKEIMTPSGFYSRKTGSDFIKFADWIPEYLSESTQVALRTEMERARSTSDEPGYIYTFEILDNNPKKVYLKVGRAVNLVKRLDQWSKQCGSEEQVLRGYYPDQNDNKESMMRGRVVAGAKGAWCHRLERLVHLELEDLAEGMVYLDPGWPNVKASKKVDATLTPKKGNAKGKLYKICPDCGKQHKEIFSFARVEKGRYKGKEWESIVKPVIEKWGAFVEAYV
ncbi:DUF1766-domain-containing protein [Heliocybe sulcata]|uniref:DUF1766-domain-containing protein n=1 Tax=Heliocybe sulcata TaxID=5364 RepID=A0A5C3MMN9_9AGAM|nr:DUF1766-domain-containing protein [Heliocybe sulcata]